MTNLLAKATPTEPKCGECAKFKNYEVSGCTYRKEIAQGILTAQDKACNDFEPRPRESREQRGNRPERQEDVYELDLNAQVAPSLKPCGFNENTLTESVYLPYRIGEGKATLRPSVIIVKKGEKPEIRDFMLQEEVKGTFPNQELQSLMSVKAVKSLMDETDISPQDVDKEIDDAFRKHLDIPDAERILGKRWIEGSFFYDVFDCFPIQSILGVSESGKSRLCLLDLSLAYHAEGLIDPTEASIFRAKEEDRVSLVIDEAEYLNNPDLFATIRILLNASYSKNSGFVTRYDEENGKRIKRRFDLYSPITISGIAGLEGITQSRAFKIVMRRANRDYPKANPEDYRELRDKLYLLRLKHAFDIHDAYKKTDISKIVTARFEELFKPIFTMTSFMGNEEERKILADFCQDYQKTFRIEALNVAEEEQILTCLAKLTPRKALTDWYRLKDLAEAVNIKYNRRIDSKHISSVLHRLGIKKRDTIMGYTVFYCTRELIEESASRIGVPLSFDATSSTNSTTSTETQPTGNVNKWKDAT